MDYSAKLRKEIKYSGVSVADLAEYTGYAESTIYDFIRGRVVNPSYNLAASLADALVVLSRRK